MCIAIKKMDGHDLNSTIAFVPWKFPSISEINGKSTHLGDARISIQGHSFSHTIQWTETNE